MTTSEVTDRLPWYKQPLVWMVIAFPATAVVVGISLLTLSLNIDLGLVSDDYYKRGKAINVDLSKDRRASELGFRGVISYESTSSTVTVTLASATGSELPEDISVDIMHATRGGMDVNIQLNSEQPGLYRHNLQRGLPAGPWEIRLSAADWRIHGRISIPRDSGASLTPLL